MSPTIKRQRMAGFTLIEMVVTLTVVSVLAMAVMSFISFGAKIYQSSTDWQQQVSQLRLASYRFSRDVTEAIPGTFAIDNVTQCLSFLPMATAERFYANPTMDGTGQLQANAISSYAPSCCVGTDCRPCEQYPAVLLNGYQAYTYNIANSRYIDNANGHGLVQFDFTDNINPATYASSGRWYLAQPKITWCAIGGKILRGEGTDNITEFVLMGEGVTNSLSDCIQGGYADAECPFVIETPSLVRNNLVRMQWWFEVDNQRQRWAQEVQLLNVP
ncbi:MAG: prepilin-type N-terminal cleavage/methylation domain-containing protein [Ferrimonas sp.]